MSLFRTFLVAVCLMTTPFLIFGAVSSMAFFQTINEKTIDETMEQKGVYSAFVPALISTANYTNQQNEAVRLPLKEKWVIDAANAAFPPEKVQTVSNTIVSGSFRWLNGETNTPDFAVNLLENKQVLADTVGVYITQRATGLPVCTQQQLFELAGNLNIYSAPCRPSFVSPEIAGQTARAEVLNDQAIFPEAVLTPENLKATTGTDPFAQLKDIRTVFTNQKIIVWVLCGLALLAVGLSILLASDRTIALKRVGVALFTASVGLALFGIIIGFIAKQAINVGIDDKLAATVLLPTVEGLVNHAQRFYFWGSGLLALAGLGSLLSYRMLKEK